MFYKHVMPYPNFKQDSLHSSFAGVMELLSLQAVQTPIKVLWELKIPSQL